MMAVLIGSTGRICPVSRWRSAAQRPKTMAITIPATSAATTIQDPSSQIGLGR